MSLMILSMAGLKGASAGMSSMSLSKSVSSVHSGATVRSAERAFRESLA